jgi:hypothetical protein
MLTINGRKIPSEYFLGIVKNPKKEPVNLGRFLSQAIATQVAGNGAVKSFRIER